MPHTGPLISITPYKPSELPNEEDLLKEGMELMRSTSAWKKGKTFFSKVRTYSRAMQPGDGAPWHCRISEHKPTEITFDQIWSKLAKNKPVNEKEFIHEIRKVTKVKEITPTSEIWTLYYTFTPPISPRVFTVLQMIHLNETSPRMGIIVSIPIDLSAEPDLQKLEEKGVRGRYASVERILEQENGNIEWTMATSSTPGGSIPSFIVESSMPKKISHDVPSFLSWFNSLSN